MTIDNQLDLTLYSDVRRFIIVAFSASPPGTMGGNTKIAIEMARHLPSYGWEVVVVVPNSKLPTFSDNIPQFTNVSYFPVKDFSGKDICRPISSSLHFRREIKSAFKALSIGKGDVVFAISNFHIDIIPLLGLRRRFGFLYIASHFLFIPFILENLRNRYRFPVLKYFVGWFYERFLFLLAKMQADAFVITNDTDRVHFDKSKQNRIFAFYGGVNVDQISNDAMQKSRDVVFCSRLHPQKGIDGLLEIWAMVVKKKSDVKLTVIGNGELPYEKFLRDKARRLGIEGNIEWLGYVNNEAKYSIYRSAKVFAHSTVYDNNGMVAAEALCSGLPVVMYDLPALRQVYSTGCVKIPYGDQRLYADALVRLITEEDHRLASAPSAEEIKALRKFWGWHSRVELFVNFLETVANNSDV